MLRHDYEQEHEHDGLRREPAPFNRDPSGSAWRMQTSLRALPDGSRLNQTPGFLEKPGVSGRLLSLYSILVPCQPAVTISSSSMTGTLSQYINAVRP